MQTNTKCVEMKSKNSCHAIFLKSQIAGTVFKHIQGEFVCRNKDHLVIDDPADSWMAVYGICRT